MITQQLIDKINTVLDAGLCSGLGMPIPGQMCVEAAICYSLGLPHSDDPGCVSPALRILKIYLNDSRWSSPKARAEGLRKLAIVQLGSKGILDDRKFMVALSEQVIRQFLPRVLVRIGLQNAALRCQNEGTGSARSAQLARAARSARSAAQSAQWAAESAESAAQWAAESAAQWAAESARSAARAARAAQWAAESAWSAAAAEAADKELVFFADLVLEVLRQVQPDLPGLKWI